ncbi:CAP domain-containing protein [Vibrio tetraodonis]|uniref:CAP domain-containing protein n=1 Tax=Vibrio tetraodonis TaxID=2231647 RepID=UPI000E0A5F9F|nr:CAP domain-containing protein [Vibrio tetraodonis]
MRQDNVLAVILTTLSISGCGGGSSSGDNNSSSSPSASTNVNPSSNQTFSTPKEQILKGNMIFAIEGLVDKGGSVSNYSSIPVKPRLPAFKGANTRKVNINIPTPTIIIDNDSRWVHDWHCYQAVGLSAQRVNNQLLVDGTFSEYRYDMDANTCTSEHLATYVFNNAVFTSSLVFESFGSVTSKTQQGSEQTLPTYHFIALAHANQLQTNFGSAWEQMQRPQIAAAAKNAGASIFQLNDSSGEITLDISQLDNDVVIDFASLDKSQILSGSIWGMPGQGAADKRWCRIVNIPDDLSHSSIKYQSVIATNCARSTQRYCDQSEQSAAGIYPPVSPIAWDSDTANNAQLNSNEQYKLDEIGHFVVNSMAQNSALITSSSAIRPIFGNGKKRSDGQVNNAGADSWAGHPGHCQNVMSHHRTKMGIGFRQDRSDSSKMFYWTQDFN